MDIGFRKLPHTSNPVYYVHPSLDIFALGMDKEGVCRFKFSEREEICQMDDLVLHMLAKANRIGKETRSREIRELIG